MGAVLWRDASDTVLVTLARAGHDAAFEELVRRRQQGVRALLRRLSGNDAVGDDLAQETFLVAWRSLHQLRDAAAFGGWLRHIAINVWLQSARRVRWLEQPLDDDETPADSASTDPIDRLDLEAALARLTAGERTCLVLNYVEGMSHAEVAAATRLPLGTVKSHIARGLERLRRWVRAIDQGA